MKLVQPPDGATLSRLYFELGRLGARSVGQEAPWEYGAPTAEEVLVLASQAARYDPRLLWVLVELLSKSWASFHPARLRAALRGATWPAALGVALEFARRVARDPELEDVSRYVMKGVPRARNEQFFLSTYAFGGSLARREAEESLAEYKRWGYLSQEEPLAKELGAFVHGTLERPERLNLLRRLVERLGSISLSDYREALGGKASARQASRDLASAPFLVRAGTTRGARYALAAARPEPLRAGQRVRIRVAGRSLGGVVLEGRVRNRSGRSRAMVRVEVQDPLDPADRYAVVIPPEWAAGVTRPG